MLPPARAHLARLASDMAISHESGDGATWRPGAQRSPRALTSMESAEELAAITGLGAAEAAVLLEAAGGDLPTAVSLHFEQEEHGGAPGRHDAPGDAGAEEYADDDTGSDALQRDFGAAFKRLTELGFKEFPAITPFPADAKGDVRKCPFNHHGYGYPDDAKTAAA